jgi:cardiolipin synthase
VLGKVLKGLSRLGLKALLFALAAQAALVAGLETAGRIRRSLRGRALEDVGEGFAWREREEVELESGDARLKLYTQGEELYEGMIEEQARAERNVFLGTFIWKDDEWGRRFVEALFEKAREGVEVRVIFDGLANVLVPAGFKNFPGEIGTLHFRNFSTPRSAADPRNVFRHHRHYMTVDGRVPFLGGFNIGSEYARTWRDTHVRIGGRRSVRRRTTSWTSGTPTATPPCPRCPPRADATWAPTSSCTATTPTWGPSPYAPSTSRP